MTALCIGSQAVFRSYCAKLSPGALAVLTRYPAAEQILWSAATS